MSATLLIPVGIPGSGKSTWAKSLFDLKYSIVSTDKIRKRLFGSLVDAHAGEDPVIKEANNGKVFRVFHERIGQQLNHSVDTIADATNLSPQARAELVSIAKQHKAKTHLVLFANPTEALVRNKERDSDQVVPDDVMLDFLAKYYEVLNDLPFETYDYVTEIRSVR